MYVCPQCKGNLEAFRCATCATQYEVTSGVPQFLKSSSDGAEHDLRKIYDEIYLHHTDVWVDQGRSTDFQSYFATLVRAFDHRRTLEVGCGEGNLLAALPGMHKFGIDPSIHALVRARRRTNAECAVARCEQLPFPPDFFDLAVAVGVMEHFEDVDAALSEINRVIKPRGHYVALIHTDLKRHERVALKVREYFWPRFRPLALVRWTGKWLNKKLRHRIVQPLRKSYTAESAADCMNRNGLRIVRIITKYDDPSAPLSGSHVVILISEKSS